MKIILEADILDVLGCGRINAVMAWLYPDTYNKSITPKKMSDEEYDATMKIVDEIIENKKSLLNNKIKSHE